MKSLLLLFLTCSLPILLSGQKLPSNSDPNKCYVRCVTPDVYETYYDDYLTYSPEEAEIFPHKVRKFEVKPELEQWETTTYEGCESDDPNDCQVLCLRKYEAEYVTIYQPLYDTLGNPFYVEVEFEELVEEGGLSSYQEIDCELTSYNVLPIRFKPGSAEFENTIYEKDVIDERLLDLLYDRPNIRIQINAHTDSRDSAGKNLEISELRAEKIMDYLVQKGINRGRIIAKGYGESNLKNRCADGVRCSESEHAVNNRVEFRVLNVDN